MKALLLLALVGCGGEAFSSAPTDVACVTEHENAGYAYYCGDDANLYECRVGVEPAMCSEPEAHGVLVCGCQVPARCTTLGNVVGCVMNEPPKR